MSESLAITQQPPGLWGAARAAAGTLAPPLLGSIGY